MSKSDSSYIKVADQAGSVHAIKDFGFSAFTEAEEIRKQKKKGIFKADHVDDETTTAYFRAVDYKGDLNEELKSAAQKMFDKAKVTLDVAEKEAEVLKRSAFEEGYEEGVTEGMKKGHEEAKNSVKDLLKIFQSGIGDLANLRKNVFDHSEGEIIDLVLMVAKKVIHEELMINRDVVLNVIKAAMQNILHKEKMTIRINPEDFDYAVSCKPDLQAYVEDLRNVVMEKDDTISRGGCIIITETGKVDAQLDNSFTEVEDLLKKNYQKQGL